MTSALQLLHDLADTHKASNNSSSSLKYTLRYNDRDVHGLSRCIIDWFTLNGHFATRLTATNDVSRYRHSRQEVNIPDVLACVHGQLVAVKIKCEQEPLSQQQKEVMRALTQAGALIYAARDFQGFYDWYRDYVQIINKSSATLYHQRHPIFYLATPDLCNPTIHQ